MALHMTTVVGNDLSVFDHMLRHYKSIGIDSLLVNVHLDRYDSPLYGQVQTITRRYGAEIVSVLAGKWLQSVNPYLIRHTICQAPDDWFVLADADELQVFPRGITTVLATLEKQGYDFVQGFVIDRVAKGGVFPAVDAEVSLWEQFPLAGLVTFPLMHANIMKVAVARGSVRTSGGQHYAFNGRACPSSVFYIPVHHFKWTSGLMDRLRARIRFYQSIGDGLWGESHALLMHCEQHGGRLNVHDPSFMLETSGMHCPHEKQLGAFVLANEAHMPTPRNVQKRV